MVLTRLPWYFAGPLISLLMIGLRATLNRPFGVLGDYIDVAENALSPARLDFRGRRLAPATDRRARGMAGL